MTEEFTEMIDEMVLATLDFSFEGFTQDQVRIVDALDDYSLCWSHYQAEWVGADLRPYRVCFECGHVYREAADLRRAWRREVWGHDRWRVLRHPLHFWKKAEDIFFCQECVHDF